MLGGATLLALMWAGCTDLGELPQQPVLPPVDTGDVPTAPLLTEIVPLRTVSGDTLRIAGVGFGDEIGVVEFRSSAGAVLAPGDVLEWTDVAITVLVPAAAAPTGSIAVRSEAASDPLPFERAPRRISYQNDLVPLFQTYFCDVCHGASGGLNVVPYADLVRGDSDHGPVVVPRRSRESHLRERLLPGTMFTRMPEGGAPRYLSDAEVLLISDWIDQGAADN